MSTSTASAGRLAKRVLFSRTLYDNTTSHTSAPAVVIIPGFWEGFEIWEVAANKIASTGYECTIIQLPSTGTVSSNGTTMYDDIYTIQEILENIIERDGKEIVLVMHSIGGLLGSNAIEGMSLAERKAKGESGGVRRLLFLSAELLPEGARYTSSLLCDFQVSDSSRLGVQRNAPCIFMRFPKPRNFPNVIHGAERSHRWSIT